MSQLSTVPTPPEDTPRPAPWLIVALWSVPACLSTFETVTFGRLSNHPIELWRAFVAEAPGWYLWAAFTPVIISLGQRYPLDRRLRAPAILVHLAASVVASALVALVSAWLTVVLRPNGQSLRVLFRGWLLAGLPATTLAYFAIVGVSYALINTARLRARERHAEQLAAQLSEAQLGALKMQLQPHFLFNSLNAVMALVRDQDSAAALRSLGLLSDVLRATLRLGSTHEVPLRAELEVIGRYLEMEQVRFGDRLRVDLAVPEDLLDCQVPTFILQPLVENALRHGIARVRAGGRIAIAAARAGPRVVITVQDDGRGLPRDWQAGDSEGLGITNTRSRLARLYGADGRLTIAPGLDGRGAIASIALPFRPVASTPVPTSAPTSTPTSTAAPALPVADAPVADAPVAADTA